MNIDTEGSYLFQTVLSGYCKALKKCEILIFKVNFLPSISYCFESNLDFKIYTV